MKGDIWYKLLKRPVSLYLKNKLNLIEETNEHALEKGSYLMLGHHVTAYDAIISNMYSKSLIRYISGDANYDNELKKKLLNMMDCIPFSKNKSDMAAILKIKRKIKQGSPIGLYPEGGRNWDGVTDYIIPSTAKLIKMLKVPVYISFHKGGFLTKPRWASYLRKGKIIVSSKLLFTKDQIKDMSVEEIHNLLKDSLQYNAFEWQKEHMIAFKGKNLAEHIERLLYKCPKCGSLDSFVSSGDYFKCKTCHVQYKMNIYGFIEGCEQFDNTADWNQWQKNFIPSIVNNDFEFTSKNVATEIIHKENNTREKKNATVTLTNEKITLLIDGTTNIIPIHKLFGLSTTFLDVCEFHYGKTKYRLTFNPKQHMSIKLFYDIIRNYKGGTYYND